MIMEESKEIKNSDSLFKNIFFNYVFPLLEMAVILFLLRTYVLEAHMVPTGSMHDTIYPGDFLLVEKVTYRLHTPVPGNIIAFKYPKEPKVKYVKRCVASEFDTVEVIDKVLYVNGKKSPYQAAFFADDNIYPRVSDLPRDPQKNTDLWLADMFSQAGGYVRDNYGPVIVPEGHLFAMGDNRDESFDSRFWGPVPVENVVGRPTFVYLSSTLIEDIPELERHQMNMWDNLKLMLKSFIQLNKIRYWRFFRIMA